MLPFFFFFLICKYITIASGILEITTKSFLSSSNIVNVYAGGELSLAGNAQTTKSDYSLGAVSGGGTVRLKTFLQILGGASNCTPCYLIRTNP